MSAMSTEVTNASGFKKGSLGKQVGLTVITFGLYMIYWWYDTHQQFAAATNTDLDPTIQTVLFLVPLANLYAIWQFSNEAEAVTDQSGTVLFVLFLVFAPAAWFLIQSGINEVAQG